MKKRLRLLLLSTIPVFVFVNVYQTYTYQKVQNQVSALELRQKNSLEENKRIIAGIAVLGAPERIEQIAKGSLGMKRHDPDPILQIGSPKGGES